VVTLKSAVEGTSYAEILRRAKSGVSLAKLGIDSAKIRDAANGGLVIEISGQDGKNKADLLAEELRTVLGSGVSVARPTKMGEIQLLGLDISISDGDICDAIASACKCLRSEVRVGIPRRLADGTRAVWVHCPAVVANELATRGKMVIGWASVRIGSFRVRPTQCFKCWHFGHVRNTCQAKVDRTGSCFRCGGSGHTVKDCTRETRCVICQDNNIDSKHRIGSNNCQSVSLRSGSRKPVSNGGG